jgi:hypothetical protein
MISNAHQIALERARHNNASRGPGFTFMCYGCKQGRNIGGRRLIDKKWYCAGCVADKAADQVTEGG